MHLSSNSANETSFVWDGGLSALIYVSMTIIDADKKYLIFQLLLLAWKF